MARKNSNTDESTIEAPSVDIDDVVNQATGGLEELGNAIRSTHEHFEGLDESVSKAKVAKAMLKLYGIKRARKA